MPMCSVRRFLFFYPPLPQEKSQSQSSIHTTSYTYLPTSYLPTYLPCILVFAFEREKREVYIFGVRAKFVSCQIIQSTQLSSLDSLEM